MGAAVIPNQSETRGIAKLAESDMALDLVLYTSLLAPLCDVGMKDGVAGQILPYFRQERWGKRLPAYTRLNRLIAILLNSRAGFVY